MSDAAMRTGSADVAREAARLLLSAGVVSINTEQLFTYASGIRSPMYCDVRLLMGYPRERAAMTGYLVDQILEAVPASQLNVIAGVATAGIPHAAWVAERLGLPMVYVRAEAKEHGKGQQIEGRAEAGWRGVVIEDTMSTGRSALVAVRALKEAGLKAEHCFSVFSYGFRRVEASFAAEGVRPQPLTTVQTYLEVAQEEGAITADERRAVEEWLEGQQ